MTDHRSDGKFGEGPRTSAGHRRHRMVHLPATQETSTIGSSTGARLVPGGLQRQDQHDDLLSDDDADKGISVRSTRFPRPPSVVLADQVKSFDSRARRPTRTAKVPDGVLAEVRAKVRP